MDVSCAIQVLSHGYSEYTGQDRFGVREMCTDVRGQQPSELAWDQRTRMGYAWIDGQAQTTVDVGLDLPNYQGVDAIWALRHRVIRRSLGVDIRARHIVAGCEISHRSASHRGIAGSDITLGSRVRSS